MSWKNADLTAVAPDATASAPWSITRRLTLFYTLSTLGLLMLATLALYQMLVKDLRYEDNQSIVGKIQDLRTILKGRPDNHRFLPVADSLPGIPISVPVTGCAGASS